MCQRDSAPDPGLSAPEFHLAAIVASTDDAIISKSLEGIITSWNPGAQKLFGYTAQEAVGRPISMLIPPEKGGEEEQIMARIRKGESITQFETIRLHKNGARIDVSLTISPVRDGSGKVVGASKIARDVTQHRLAQEQIRLERERLQVTLASIGDAVLVTDERGVVEFLNPIAETLTGWRQEDAQGKPLDAVFNIVQEGTHEPVESPAANAMRRGVATPLANHTVLIRRDGAELAIDDTAAPIRDGSGKVTGAILVFRDVTTRRAVQAFQARLSAIVENSDDAIVGKDLEGRITSWNKGAERIFGYSREEAVGRPITMIIPGERLGEEAHILRRLRRGERIDHYETVRIAKGGRQVDVSLTISPILDTEGNVVGAAKIARDITERKKAARDLAEANRRLREHALKLEEQVAARTMELKEGLEELETFSSGLTHDIKTPLRAISGYARVLHEDYGASLPDEAKEFVRRMVQTCERLSRLVDNVQSYSWLRRGHFELERVELETLVPQVIDEHSHAKESAAEVLIRGPLLAVQGNEGLLTQVLSNLVSNAVKFVPSGTRPRITIWTEPREESVRLWVADNGIGIPQRDQQRLFDLFTRLQSASAYPGTGIGLAVVRRAVRAMGGNVGLESEEGKSSRFWVELRAATQK